MLLFLIVSCNEVQSYSTMHLFKGWHFQHWALTRMDFELQSISAFQFASCIQPGTKLINSIQSANFPITERFIISLQIFMLTKILSQTYINDP